MSNYKTKYNNKIKGITLIALVITIIILILLAGISLNMIIKDDGLISKVLYSRKESDKAQALEELRLKTFEVKTNKEGSATLQDIANTLFSEAGNKYLFSTDMKIITGERPYLEDKNELYVKYKDYWFKIDSDLGVYFFDDFNIADNESEDIIDIEKEYSQKLGATYDFDYNGTYQEFEIKDTGYYEIQCWGASGGNSYSWDKYYANEGTGGYASGKIKLKKGEKIYIYVGQQGAKGFKTKYELTQTSFNGGRCRYRI